MSGLFEQSEVPNVTVALPDPEVPVTDVGLLTSTPEPAPEPVDELPAPDAEIIPLGEDALPPPGAEIIPLGATEDELPSPGAAVEPLSVEVPDMPPVTNDELTNLSPIGRVLDAFELGFDRGWGADPLGLSPETEQTLRDIGMFNSITEESYFDSVRFFNQGVIRPLAVGVDALLRTLGGTVYGLAEGVGETTEVTGLAEAVGLPGSSLTRDLVALADVVGIVTATHASPATRPLSKRQRTAMTTRADRETVNRMASLNAATPEEFAAANVTPLRGPNTSAIDKAGNINLARISAPEDIKQVIREVSDANDGFPTARRGRMTHADTVGLADAAGVSVDALLKRKVGQAFNAEEATAARDLLVQSATNVREMARRAIGGTEQQVIDFQLATTRHMAIQEQVAGVAAEAGRALQAHRIMSQANRQSAAVADILEEMGGRGSVESIARRVSELESPKQISKFTAEARKATLGDQVLEVWINGLLSGPKTHLANIASNTVVAVLMTPTERLAAAAVSAARGTKGAERVRFGEFGAQMAGLVQGTREGIRAGYRAFKTEMPTNRAEKLELPRPKSVPSKKFKIGDKEFDLGGKQVRLPGRFLTAEDEFFKAIGYRQELNALAYRAAANEGLRGRALYARMSELVENPSKKLRKAASDAGEYQTFTKPLGEAGQAVQKFVNTHPALKIPMTFIRTPVNIVKFAGERTVFSLFSPTVRDILRGNKGAAAQSQQIARLTVGSSIGIAAWSLANEGLITGGGPTDPRERAMLYMSGWQPFSLKVGDMYYSYARAEPLGIMLGISADMNALWSAATDDEQKNLAAMVAASVSKNLTSKSWTQGLAQVINVAQDPDRYGESYIRNLAGSVVPSIVGQVASDQDPILRDAQTILEKIRSRVPGLSEDVPVRRDISGQPIVREGSFGPAAMSRVKDDPVVRELITLKVFPSKLGREIRGVDLTAAQYDDYQVFAGGLTWQMLGNAVGAPGWGNAPEFARREIVTKMVTRARETARRYMLAKYPNIMREAWAEKVKEMGGPLTIDIPGQR